MIEQTSGLVRYTVGELLQLKYVLATFEIANGGGDPGSRKIAINFWHITFSTIDPPLM